MVVDDESGGPSLRFPATRHSAILAAQSDDASQRERGIAALSAIYWKPAYKYLRVRFRRSNEDAADLTQGFFALALEKEFFDGYDPSRGSFRTFLRTCLDRFVANADKSAARIKRSPGSPLLSLDFANAEEELRKEGPADERNLERYFHDQWVRSLLAHAVEELERTCKTRDKEVCFRIFARYELERSEDEKLTYQRLSEEFGILPTQVTNFLAYARREFQRIVLERLREITASDREFREEAKQLFGVSS
jgi:DNA-directed RNA polymerase specialized sigma24 family protein